MTASTNSATASASAHSRPPGPMLAGRQADSARRRQRVIATLTRAATNGEEISVSAIARAAGVDRTFLYRHRDLLAQVHALETAPPATSGAGPSVTRASLQSDLLAAQERALRMTSRIQQLERRLSEVTLADRLTPRECSGPPRRRARGAAHR